MKRAMFAGSFDPFTVGHADIVERGLMLFDELIIAVGQNINKNGSTDANERARKIRSIYANNPRINVMVYSELTVDLARELDVQFLLRGVRGTMDADYEQKMADANFALAGIETVVLYAKPELAYISSTLVRDLQKYGKDVSKYLPE